MDASEAWYVKTDGGKVYGPAEKSRLVTWVEEGRIGFEAFVSRDCVAWLPAYKMPELGLSWLVEVAPGKVYGPFCRAVAIRLFKEHRVPPSSRAYRLHEFPIDQDPPPVEKVVEKEVIKEVFVEVPAKSRPADSRAIIAAPRGMPAKVSRPLFSNYDPEKLRAIEAAAQRELATAQRRGIRFFGFLGGKKR